MQWRPSFIAANFLYSTSFDACMLLFSLILYKTSENKFNLIRDVDLITDKIIFNK